VVNLRYKWVKKVPVAVLLARLIASDAWSACFIDFFYFFFRFSSFLLYIFLCGWRPLPVWKTFTTATHLKTMSTITRTRPDGTTEVYRCLDLHNQQYSEEELLEHYCRIDNRSILRTQKGLSADFCVKYLLDCEDWGIRLCYEEAYIFDVDVLRHQPHLTQEDLQEARRRLEPERLELMEAIERQKAKKEEQNQEGGASAAEN
jgi:hypothetical protein